MARIAGVDFPPQKRAEIGLTYIYGIGRARANKVLAEANVDINRKIRDLSEEEINRIRTILDAQGNIEGDLQKTDPTRYQAPHGYRLLSRVAPPAWAPRSRPENPYQCPHAQGPASRNCCQEEGPRQEVRSNRYSESNQWQNSKRLQERRRLSRSVRRRSCLRVWSISRPLSITRS